MWRRGHLSVEGWQGVRSAVQHMEEQQGRCEIARGPRMGYLVPQALNGRGRAAADDTEDEIGEGKDCRLRPQIGREAGRRRLSVRQEM